MANEKTNAATGLVLYVANYRYVHKTGAIRNGSFVIEAQDITEAQKAAPVKLAALGHKSYRLVSIKEW